MTAPTDLIERLEGASVPWRCLHCDEIFTDRQGAQDHFGLTECEHPTCIVAATETQKAIIEDRREWRERALKAEADQEQTAYELHLMQYDLRYSRHFRGAKSLTDVENAFESMEGRALAAEDALDVAPRWFRNWLRTAAERRAILALRASEQSK